MSKNSSKFSIKKSNFSTKEKDPRAPNSRWLTPYLTVIDCKKSIEFYEAVFGFKTTRVQEDKGKIIHVEMVYHGKHVIMFSEEGAFDNPNKAPLTTGVEMPMSLYLYVDDVKAISQKAKDLGATILIEPMEAFWGDEFAGLKDINGYSWQIARHLWKPNHEMHHHHGDCDHEH